LPQSRNEQSLLEQEFGKLSEWLAIIKYEYGILPECPGHPGSFAPVSVTEYASGHIRGNPS
jgi:hypothetical protein